MTKELSKRARKTRSRQFSGKITPKPTDTDTFTLLCRSQMGVECVKEYRFYQPRRWRFDYAIPLYKIAVEVEGGVWTQGRHIRPQGFLDDIEKYNTAALLGWRGFRCTPDKLITNSTILLLKNAINGAFLPPTSEK